MKHDLNRNLQWRAKRLYALFACLVLTLPFAVVPAFAADDPLSVVTSLSDFIFSLIRAVGLIRRYRRRLYFRRRPDQTCAGARPVDALPLSNRPSRFRA